MGYVYLLFVAFMFSFVGTCVKTVSPHFSPEFVTFFRFSIGVLFLLLLKLIKNRKIHFDFFCLKAVLPWVIFGGVVKWLAYLMENIALAQGASYSNIVLQPAQTITITVVSIVLFKEKFTLRKLICILMCMTGVLCISWNGRPLADFVANIALSGLYVIAGVFAGSHVLSQKMIGDKMDIIDSNLAIFVISGLISAVPLVPQIASGCLTGLQIGPLVVVSIIAIGFFTGIGFYLNAKAIPLVPFYMVPILQSTMVFFALIWGMLFFDEKITVYVVCGTVLFVAGLIGLNLSNGAKKQIKEA